MLGAGKREVTHNVQAMSTTGRPTGHDAQHHLGHEPNEPLDLQDMQPPGPGRVDRGRRITVGIAVAVLAADALIATRAKGPPTVFRRWTITGENHAPDVARHASVVERGEQFIHGVRSKGVAHFGPMERHPHRSLVNGAVIGDVGEVEPRHLRPRRRIEQLRHLVTHTETVPPEPGQVLGDNRAGREIGRHDSEADWEAHRVTNFDAVAALYDHAAPQMYTNEVLGPAVDFLAHLAGDGRALEFAVGTGRVALPLSQRGVEVHGIELSGPMVGQMLAKPGADRISVTIGDMATTRIGSSFRLVYLVYNTITNLSSQDEQVECFRNAAAHLEPGGKFVIEVFVPALRRLPVGESFVPFDVTAGHLGIDEYDVANQMLISHHYWITNGRAALFNSLHRYAWPAEYDLMAKLAGMTLSERWSNWHREPFTSNSTAHVSVWEKPAE